MKKLLLITLFNFIFLNLYINCGQKSMSCHNFYNNYKEVFDSNYIAFSGCSKSHRKHFFKNVLFDNKREKIYILMHPGVFVFEYKIDKEFQKIDVFNDLDSILKKYAHEDRNFYTYENNIFRHKEQTDGFSMPKDLKNLKFIEKIILNDARFDFYNVLPKDREYGFKENKRNNNITTYGCDSIADLYKSNNNNQKNIIEKLLDYNKNYYEIDNFSKEFHKYFFENGKLPEKIEENNFLKKY